MAVTESFIKCIRMRIHAYRIYTHTHTPSSHCLSCLHKEHPRDHPLLPILHHFYFYSRLHLVSFLPFDSPFLYFGLSPSLFPRSHMGGRVADQTCNNMSASLLLESTPFTPSLVSFVLCSSVHHHPSTLLVISSIDLAGAMAMRVCDPPPAIIRQAPIHQRRPLCGCVSHDRLYVSFCAPGQLCLGLDRACRILNAICALSFHFMHVYTHVPLICVIISRYSTRWACYYFKQRSCGCTHTCTPAACVQVRSLAVNTLWQQQWRRWSRCDVVLHLLKLQ